MKCECCGKSFEVGNDYYGLPNGIGIPNNFGYVTNFCSACITFRNDRALKIAEMNKFKKPEDDANA